MRLFICMSCPRGNARTKGTGRCASTSGYPLSSYTATNFGIVIHTGLSFIVLFAKGQACHLKCG